MSDHDLLAEVVRVAGQERQVTADLIALVAEVDARKLYLAEGCASLYAYCVERLRLSEHAAYHRMEAARAVRRFPVILQRLVEGSVTLTAITLLRPHLTEENHLELLARAAGRGKREVEVFVRGLAPRPDVRTTVRKLPVPRENGGQAVAAHDGPPAASPPAPEAAPRSESAATGNRSAAATPTPLLHPAVIRPLAPTRYSLRLTITAETHEKLRRAQDLLRHTIPDGDPAAIIDRALTLLVAQLGRTKFAAQKRRPPAVAQGKRRCRHHRLLAPSGGRTDGEEPATCASRDAPTARVASGRSRHIPAAVKRAVWDRDGGRCAFQGSAGRCSATGLLEFHHRLPFAEGGEATATNLELRCRAHNGFEARRWFGADNDAWPETLPPGRADRAGAP